MQHSLALLEAQMHAQQVISLKVNSYCLVRQLLFHEI